MGVSEPLHSQLFNSWHLTEVFLPVNIYHMRLRSDWRSSGLVADWLQKFDERCRSRGIRLTAQRRAVFRVLAEDSGHPTIEDIHARLKEHWPSLPLPTVYRIAEDLVETGMIRRVASEEGPFRFDANMERHQHAVCRVCGRMGDINVPSLAKLSLPSALPDGFSAEDYDIRITGLCHSCAGKIKEQSRKPNSRRRK